MKLAIQTHRHSGRIVTCGKRHVCWQISGARIRAADRSRRHRGFGVISRQPSAAGRHSPRLISSPSQYVRASVITFSTRCFVPSSCTISRTLLSVVIGAVGRCNGPCLCVSCTSRTRRRIGEFCSVALRTFASCTLVKPGCWWMMT